MNSVRALEGQTAVVLGIGADEDFGWCVAQQWAAHGAHVFAAARKLEMAQKLVIAVGGTPVRCDMTNDEDVAALARHKDTKVFWFFSSKKNFSF